MTTWLQATHLWLHPFWLDSRIGRFENLCPPEAWNTYLWGFSLRTSLTDSLHWGTTAMWTRKLSNISGLCHRRWRNMLHSGRNSGSRLAMPGGWLLIPRLRGSCDGPVRLTRGVLGWLQVHRQIFKIRSIVIMHVHHLTVSAKKAYYEQRINILLWHPSDICRAG